MQTTAETTQTADFDQIMTYTASALSVVEVAMRIRSAHYRPQAIQHARRAFDLVQQLSAEKPLEPDEAHELTCAMRELKEGLLRLGERV